MPRNGENRSSWSRRSFVVRSIAAGAGGLLAWPAFGASSSVAKIAVFFDPDFPTVDLEPLSRETLTEALSGFDVSFLNGVELGDAARLAEYRILVMPFGSAFPKSAWPSIHKFLTDGGSLVNLGGVPFAVPVVVENGRWRQESRQTAYHKTLSITEAFAVPSSRIAAYRPAESPWTDGFHAKTIYELYLRLTATKDQPLEIGSAGTRDAVIQASVHGVDTHDEPVAAPFVEIDRLQGAFAGGRWVLANIQGSLSAAVIRELVERALPGAWEFDVHPSFASYYGSERPSFQLRLLRPRGRVEQWTQSPCRLDIRDEQGRVAISVEAPLLGTGSLALGTAELPAGPLPPGSYRVDATLGALRYRTGFWMCDASRASGLEGGEPFTCTEDFLCRGGKPYPVTGTTYMAADTQRKFLFEPNPFLWDRDFAAMKAAGVNMVRTGLWTGWKQMVPEAGRPTEQAMRSLDAFLLTARRHGIPVVLNLFAFLPETWGGQNPYFDPRALDAQKQFAAELASRYRDSNDLLWDLINEPSFSSFAQLWRCRPNYDAYEAEAWRKWVNARRANLADEWGTTPLDSPDLPALDDFDDANIFENSHPLRALDYRLFAQEMFNNWVTEISAAIRAAGNPRQLITVGQDEGGLSDRPNPLFHDSVVDFTCIHNWWLNDDLLWDSIMTKSPSRPNLVEETGIMFAETMRRTPWRTEDEARKLLERKLGLAIGANGAGFIQWLWNTNSYLPSDNEASIGFLRADGSAKPELAAFKQIAAFFHRHSDLLTRRVPEDAVMVVPHSQMFSVRDYATAATKRAVRVMHYECGIPMRVAGEYSVSRNFKPAPFILLPSLCVLSQPCWAGLLAEVRRGATLLVSGVFDRDEYWRETSRSLDFGLRASRAAVVEEETVRIEGIEYLLSYRGEKTLKLEKDVVEGEAVAAVRTVPLGKGKIVWAPVPMELAEETAPLAALYRYALKQAGVASPFSVERADPSVLIRPTLFDRAVLYTIVSESSRDMNLSVTHLESGTRFAVTLPAQCCELVFLDRRTGAVLGMLKGDTSGSQNR
jgi:hypothetical protein